MTPHTTLWHEWRTTLSRPAAVLSFLLLGCMLGYGAFNGRVERQSRSDAIAGHEAEVAASTGEWLTQLQTIETKGPGPGVPPWAGSAMDATLSSSLPPAPLADFAIGQSDLLPYLGALSLWDPDIRLFSRYEFDDPIALALGAFDLSKAVILVLPLLLIVLSFDALSADRDAGRLALMLAQGARIRSLFWARLSVRATAMLGVLFLVACCALLVPVDAVSLAARLPFFGLWLLATLLYGGFWIGVIAWIASGNRSGAVNLAALLLVWAGLTVLLPAGVAAIAEAAYPMPSRLAYLADAREVEIETELAESETAAGFVLDHPGMVIDATSQMPAYVRTAFLATKSVDAATRPTLLQFEGAAARRERSLRFMRYLSPAIAAHGVFVDIAGSSAQRHRQYLAKARALKAQYADLAGPSIVAGRRLPLEQAAALPSLRLQSEEASAALRRNISALGLLGLVTGLLLWLADRRLRRV
jgi:ABC-2 type transport system permease protein